MTHFTVTVCLDPAAQADPVHALKTGMRPYDLIDNEDHGEWVRRRLPRPPRPGPHDSGGHRRRRRNLGGLVPLRRPPPPARPLSAFHHEDRAQNKRDHLAQPLVQALAQHALKAGDEHYPVAMITLDPVAHFACGEREYLARATSSALPTYALLTTDGHWSDPENPTPWAHPHRPSPHRMPTGAWPTRTSGPYLRTPSSPTSTATAERPRVTVRLSGPGSSG